MRVSIFIIYHFININFIDVFSSNNFKIIRNQALISHYSSIEFLVLPYCKESRPCAHKIALIEANDRVKTLSIEEKEGSKA